MSLLSYWRYAREGGEQVATASLHSVALPCNNLLSVATTNSRQTQLVNSQVNIHARTLPNLRLFLTKPEKKRANMHGHS